ncbi:MAG: O-antigen translocase [Rhodospirillales bacterium]
MDGADRVFPPKAAIPADSNEPLSGTEAVGAAANASANASAGDGDGEAAQAPAEERSYGQILKSSALIGGSSVLTIAIGIVRAKAMAMLLGPAGFGLMGVYGSIADLARSVAEMGINSSGVRQIAEAVGSGDEARIAMTVVVLRRTAVVLGLIGLTLLVALAVPVSTVTFGSDAKAGAVALLGFVVCLQLISAGQGALLQGMRRITDMAKMGVLGPLLGTAVGIALVYTLGEEGVVPALMANAAAGLVFSWWYSRKVKVALPTLTRPEVAREASALLKLGFAFMASGMLMMGAAYAVRTIVLRTEGLDAAGLYSAAWTLGGLYVGIILQAMGADFYPRLVGAANDDVKGNRLVNEQAQISLLLAAPGVIATIVFAPLVLHLFYSPQFAEAIEVLRWICLGIALRVITWPMGFIIVAKNRRLIFIVAEVAWTAVNVALTWLAVQRFGLAGAGIAFFASYVFHGVMIYTIVRKLSGFRWFPENIKTGLIFLASIGFSFCGFYMFSPLQATVCGVLIVLCSGAYTLLTLVKLMPSERAPERIRHVIQVCRQLYKS